MDELEVKRCAILTSILRFEKLEARLLGGGKA